MTLFAVSSEASLADRSVMMSVFRVVGVTGEALSRTYL